MTAPALTGLACAIALTWIGYRLGRGDRATWSPQETAALTQAVRHVLAARGIPAEIGLTRVAGLHGHGHGLLISISTQTTQTEEHP